MPSRPWPEERGSDPEWDEWDPVMLTDYLLNLDPPTPGTELILEIRRQVLNGDRVSVDIRRRLLAEQPPTP